MEFKRKVLENGMTILHEKRDVPVTTVMMACRYGSVHETVVKKGTAHFMEHLCFKGTEKRNAKRIAEEVEELGGKMNAFTSEEATAYYVTLPSNHFGTAAEVIFDIFFNATFPDDEFEKEANVICEEIRMHKDNPRSRVVDQIKASLYKPPFGLGIAGSEEGVRAMKRDYLFKEHRKYYCPENSIFVVVGNNEFEEVLEIAKKYAVERIGENPTRQKIEKIVEKREEKRKNLSQSNLTLGYHFPFIKDKERYAAEIFSAILGQGMSSKLNEEIREKKGLVYAVLSDIDIGEDYGYMIIWAGTDPSKVDEVISLCSKEFSKMEKLSEGDLEKAKIQVIGNRKVESEGSNETALNLIVEEIAGNANSYYEYEKKINEVKLEDIRKIAKKTKFSSFVLGP